MPLSSGSRQPQPGEGRCKGTRQCQMVLQPAWFNEFLGKLLLLPLYGGFFCSCCFLGFWFLSKVTEQPVIKHTEASAVRRWSTANQLGCLLPLSNKERNSTRLTPARSSNRTEVKGLNSAPFEVSKGSSSSRHRVLWWTRTGTPKRGAKQHPRFQGPSLMPTQGFGARLEPGLGRGPSTLSSINVRNIGWETPGSSLQAWPWAGSKERWPCRGNVVRQAEVLLPQIFYAVGDPDHAW